MLLEHDALRFSEIGCRPPGVGAWDLYSAANDADLYREWAHCIVHDRPDQALSRRYSAGIVALRPGSNAALPDLPIGARVRIMPNHACATAAQHARYEVLDEAGHLAKTWPRINGW